MTEKGRKTNRSITMKDIAKKLKVSVTTVSLSLSDQKSSRISDDTRKKIVKVAKRLNYRPNYMARSLVGKETNSIGLVLTTLRNPFYAEIAQDIIERATELDYSVSIFSAREGLQNQHRSIEDFVKRGIDGLIICSALREDAFIYELADKGFPFVLAMRNVKIRIGKPPIDYIVVDNVRGGFMATEHLIKMGHKRIALILGPKHTSTGYDRHKGALAALNEYGITADPKLILTGDFFRNSGYDLAKRLLKQNQKPTAIFAANDHMAIGVVDALHENGLTTPEDMALIGFDDIEMSGLPGIDLTTVSQKKAMMGSLAVDHLIAKYKGDKAHFVQATMLDPILVIRKSCGFHERDEVNESLFH